MVLMTTVLKIKKAMIMISKPQPREIKEVMS
jgi:hypothetical protein